MGSKSSPPAAPDPYTTANANSVYNKDTAAYNAALNRNNVYTPLGSSTWQQNGVDSTGAPLWDNSIQLTPTAQGALDAGQMNQLGMANLNNRFLGNVASQLADPLDPSGLPKIQSQVQGGDLDAARQQAQDAIYKQQTSMLDPQYEQQKKALDANLAAQGITLGSEAYNNEQNNFARQRDFAYNQARSSAITGGNDYAQQQFGRAMQAAGLNNAAQQLSFAQMLGLREQPLNELNALRSGAQVQMPSFQGTPASNAQAPDFLTAQQQNLMTQLNGYNANVGADNSFTSGMMGIGAAAMMAF